MLAEVLSQCSRTRISRVRFESAGWILLIILLCDVCPLHRVLETFEAFLEYREINEKAVDCLRDLQEIEMRHSIALWKLAMQIKKGIKDSESV